MRPRRRGRHAVVGQNLNPPLNNVMLVSGFVPADFLISIDAIAVVPLDE